MLSNICSPFLKTKMAQTYHDGGVCKAFFCQNNMRTFSKYVEKVKVSHIRGFQRKAPFAGFGGRKVCLTQSSLLGLGLNIQLTFLCQSDSGFQEYTNTDTNTSANTKLIWPNTQPTSHPSVIVIDAVL